MGLWNGLVKIAQGKPVFEAADQRGEVKRQASSAVKSAPSSGAAVDSTGHKIIPEVVIEHCETHLNGSEIDVTVWATNTSSVEIELDKIVMLGMTCELDRFLGPGEAHQLRLYKGTAPINENYHKANLYYKQVKSGDYFCADFMVEYDYDAKGFYIVDELHPIRPVRDV